MTRNEANQLAEDGFASGQYAKNLTYMFGEGTEREFGMAKQYLGSSGMTAWVTFQLQRKVGAQVQVQKEVSDDLRETDFRESTFGNVIWPAEAVEVYFEDPLLPTIILARIDNLTLHNQFPWLMSKIPDGSILVMMQHGKGDKQRALALNLPQEQAARFVVEAETEAMPLPPLGNPGFHLSDQDHAVMAEMIRLSLKVFAFASIPRFKPVPLTRKQMHFGGKPGIGDRPQRPAVRVVYLPNVRSIEQPGLRHETTGTGEAKAPHRRRGHLRYFSSPRFVNKQGEWTFVAPARIHGDQPLPVPKFVVRKPT